ncbi:DUF3857 domain-containing protein [uncultured Sunxiuqinia sp.]|uniref:DUF3857 domain-containing protein n=1 Tax=uncultured Sunxiuqinia sp. TaxID=1573825 RepID=UPI002AA80439|nr:DUF3857 domain-containing protein [uncultured Sunxiuqinia sp.]
MKKSIFFLPFFFLLSAYCFGQQKFNVSLIADSLIEEADAVIRYSDTKYIRNSIDHYQKSVYFVATVLNANGRSSSNLNIYYDRNSSISSIEINIYDEAGNLVKKVKKKDINDYAYNNSYTLMSDSRIKYYSPSQNYYPYTVEYSYTIDHKSVVGFKNWHPTDWFNNSAESAQLTFETPGELKLNYKELNADFKAKLEVRGNTTIYRWEIKNLKAIKEEPMSPPYLDQLPTVMLAPSEVSFEGYTGDFSSWKSMGHWTLGLMKDRQELPNETITKIKELTDTIETDREKVKAIYKYMQRKTRYVNIALGIGGYQPLPASAVDSKGYGDCKALSNYMRSLLQCVGINAHYSEIGSGKNQQIKYPEFPSTNQTNHIIVCVPLRTDTVWLECTNQNFPFGYIGSSNSNRFTLLITEAGGVLAKTPTYEAENNYRKSTIDIKLNENGGADFTLNSHFSNCSYEDVFPYINRSIEEQKKFLLRSLDVDALSIDDFSLLDTSNDQASARLSLDGNNKSYSLKAGTRLLFQPSFIYSNDFPLIISNDRIQSIYEPIGYTYQDSITISIPSTYDIEFIPHDSKLTSVYGIHQLSYSAVYNQMITIKRSVTINQGQYPPSSFEEINRFLKECSSTENEKIVLKKKST